MKNTIYIHLQRSLVKVFSKSINFHKYKTSVLRPSKTFTSLADLSKSAIKKSYPLLVYRKNYKINQLFYLNKRYLLNQKPKQAKKNTKKTYFIAWDKQEKLRNFRQSFYSRKNKKQKTFIFLFHFFCFFSVRTNKKISFLKSELARQFKRAQKVLYLHKIFCFTFVPFTNFPSTNIDLENTLDCLLIRKEKQEKLCFFLQLLPLLVIIFYYYVKYIKHKKTALSKEPPFFFTNIYKFNKMFFEKNFFKSFHCQNIQENFNSHFFFMRPLFSLTRLDTFSICESLKLPIYPDKSNLRVDFLRNRVRKQILPAIRILLNPQFDTILCKFNEYQI